MTLFAEVAITATLRVAEKIQKESKDDMTDLIKYMELLELKFPEYLERLRLAERKSIKR